MLFYKNVTLTLLRYNRESMQSISSHPWIQAGPDTALTKRAAVREARSYVQFLMSLAASASCLSEYMSLGSSLSESCCHAAKSTSYKERPQGDTAVSSPSEKPRLPQPSSERTTAPTHIWLKRNEETLCENCPAELTLSREEWNITIVFSH